MLSLSKCGAVVCAAVALLPGCGKERGDYVLDPSAATTTTGSGSAVSSAPAALGTSTTGGPPRTSTSSTAPATPWVDVTRNLVGLRSDCQTVTFVSSPPGSDSVLVSVVRQGIFRGDGVSDWTRLGSSIVDNRTSSIQYDPTNPAAFWLSGTYGPGVFRTTDGGVSFTRSGAVEHIESVGVDFADPARSTLVAGTHESNQTFRSSDGGRTWVDITASLGLNSDTGDVASILVVDAQTYAVGTIQGSRSGIYRTSDGGKTFARVYSGPVVGQVVWAGPGEPAYWLLRNGAGVIRSTDNGLTWQVMGGAGRIAPDAPAVVRLPDGRLVTVGQRLVVSADGGATWKPFGPLLPYMPLGVAYSAGQKAFYVWRWNCANDAPNDVTAGSIYRLDAGAL